MDENVGGKTNRGLEGASRIKQVTVSLDFWFVTDTLYTLIEPRCLQISFPFYFFTYFTNV